MVAAGCGINVARYKLMAFCLGAFWAGMAGTLYAANIRSIEPTSFNFFESVILFAIVISVVFLKERASLWRYAAGALIALGVLILRLA